MQSDKPERQAPALENLIATTSAAQVSVLHNVLPKLQRLEEALVTDQAEQSAGLNKFETDKGLDRLGELIEKQRNEFDALNFVGQLSRLGGGRALWGQEEFHSRMLAWLLDPRQGHGLGDRFLNPFLLRAGVRPTAHSTDWSATKVVREWGNAVDGQPGRLDILIVNEAQRFLCAIENKVFSNEHSEQLTRYRKALELSHPTFAKYHLFLTRVGDIPFREEEREYWTPLTYSMIHDIVRQIVEDNDNSPNEDVRAFLRQYATTVRINLMPETNIPKLARRIYLEHREAIEQINANEPDWVSEAKLWLEEAVARQSQWKLAIEDPNCIRFRSADWDQYEATQTGTGWAPRSGALLLFEFQFDDGFPWLQLALSPVDEAYYPLRKKLFEAIWQHPKLFKPKSTSLSQGWMILHEQADFILDEADYGIGWDDGATRAKVEEWVAYFAANDFPAMNEVIVNCLREYETDQKP